jgi:hypothetical protein
MSTTTSDPGAPPRERRPGPEKKGGLVAFVSDKAIPLLIAVLSLATALAGTWGALATARAKNAEADRTQLEHQVTRLADDNTALQDDKADLQAQVHDLTATTTTTRLTDDSERPTTGTSGQGSRSSTILRQTGDTPVTFTSGYAIDIDSPDANWHVTQGGGDLRFYLSPSSGPQLSTPEVAVVDHVATKAECEDATVRQPILPRDLVRVDTQFCTRSYDGHTAYVHIADIDTDARTITLDIIVWE